MAQALQCTVILVTIIITIIHAKVSSFRIHARTLMEDKFIYVDKFCFDKLGAEFPGVLKWSVTHPNSIGVKNITINVYDDEEISWPRMLRNSVIDCSNIRTYAKRVFPLDQFMQVTIDVQEGHYYFWYIIVDACQYIHTERSEYIDIRFEWYNPGGYFKHQFSLDKQGILETMLFILPVLCIIVLISIYNFIRLIMGKILHFITRIYYVSLLCYFLHILFQFIFYCVYGNNGYGVLYMDDASLVFRLVAEVLFVSLMFLISSGWLITQSYIRHLNVLAALLVTFSFVYTFLFVWVEIGIHTDTDAEYIFETTPGLVIGALRLAALMIFIYSLRTTLKKEQNVDKVRFYKIFGILFAPWFMILPAIISLNFAIPRNTYMRTKVIEGISMHIELIYYTIMLVMLWHSRLTKFFGVNTENSAGFLPRNVREDNTLYDEL